MRFTIPGKPVPCPRATQHKGRAYYKPEYAAWMDMARWELKNQHDGSGIKYPVSVTVRVYGVRLQSDADNYLKAGCDAMQPWVLESDNLKKVPEMHVYGTKEGEPRMEIEIQPL